MERGAGILVKIQCIAVGASLSIIHETSHHVYLHKHVSCTCHEWNLQAIGGGARGQGGLKPPEIYLRGLSPP